MRTDTARTAAFTARQGIAWQGTGSRDAYEGARDDAGDRDYDEYRVKLYKVACRTARERREQLRID
jgi:hypothetical protein